ncbi:hypothetical protein [Vulgatibacter sp.]|uniref:hypothetical protein n=1 Tax=Vulgatibacter sp. TaxID=1971226 RepID=UPI0035633873
MRTLLVAAALLGAAGCATTTERPRPETAEPAPASAATRFLDAVEAARWDDAFLLLSERWRASLTPARLAADWEQGGALAADRLERARLALREQPRREGDRVRFGAAGGSGLVLVEEPGGWRVDGFE